METTPSSLILQELQQAQEVLTNFIAQPSSLQVIEEAAQVMATCLQNGGKILSCGNGGSMCDAMHFAEELTGRYRDDRAPMAAISISDPSHLSCVSNDYGYDQVFSRYVQALIRPGDVLLGISTSGNSGNVLKAAQVAKEMGAHVVTLTGKDGGQLASLSEVEIRVPHFGYADRIQEVHIKVIHILILLLEKHMAYSISL
ncbi:phosphoheptose isomerase [Rufibacter radiotolerans]|uniref:Phosphoheptose isomerase n=1 Tax=Rufibacter radiotolerans TaxID=1379910 RepID=A0A0H4WA50_9BACT|nr:D-sedoheptulose 7-phosphate isomerase [Rufibacter radiotolerans]AKQ47356.1 phosphoheptose isomerase [Rufibacter radiotolerans]